MQTLRLKRFHAYSLVFYKKIYVFFTKREEIFEKLS